MDARSLLLAAGLGLALSGCQSNVNQMLVERELRLQEDEIYRLREVVEDYRHYLDSCRKENDALRQRLGEPRPASTGPASSSPTILTPRGAGGAPPAFSPQGEPLELVPPTVILPSETIPPGRLLPGPGPAPSGPPSGGRRDAPRLDELREPGGPELRAPTGHVGDGTTRPTAARADSRQVADVWIDTAGTGGSDADGRRGDEGIRVTLVPRDPQGRPIDAPADVTLVVLDPALEGDAARVARWDLSTLETARCFHQTAGGPAMHLETRWPNGPPLNGQLHLFVRYTTADGRAIKVDQPIEVALPGAEVGWRTPEAPTRAIAGPASTSRGTIPSAAASAAPTWQRSEAPHVRVPAGTDTSPQPTTARPSPPPASQHTPRDPVREARLQRPAWSPNRL